MHALFLDQKQRAHALFEFGGSRVGEFRGGERCGEGGGFQLRGFVGAVAQPEETDAPVNRGDFLPKGRRRRGRGQS